jgi:hypothetical protein
LEDLVIDPTPDRVEAACVAIDSYLAGNLSAAACAATIEWIPTTHPARGSADEVRVIAAKIRKGNAKEPTLRSFCEQLRAGKAAMMSGWYPLAKVPVWDPGAP